MARKARDTEEQQTQPTEVYTSFGEEVIETSATLVNPSPMRPSVADRAGIEVEGPSQYRVLASQYVMSRGGRTLLRAGKIVDAHNFDLAALASQGVQLELLPEAATLGDVR